MLVYKNRKEKSKKENQKEKGKNYNYLRSWAGPLSCGGLRGATLRPHYAGYRSSQNPAGSRPGLELEGQAIYIFYKAKSH